MLFGDYNVKSPINVHNGVTGQNNEQHLPKLSPPIPFHICQNYLEISSKPHFPDIPRMIIPRDDCMALLSLPK